MGAEVGQPLSLRHLGDAYAGQEARFDREQNGPVRPKPSISMAPDD